MGTWVSLIHLPLQRRRLLSNWSNVPSSRLILSKWPLGCNINLPWNKVWVELGAEGLVFRVGFEDLIVFGVWTLSLSLVNHLIWPLLWCEGRARAASSMETWVGAGAGGVQLRVQRALLVIWTWRDWRISWKGSSVQPIMCCHGIKGLNLFSLTAIMPKIIHSSNCSWKCALGGNSWLVLPQNVK